MNAIGDREGETGREMADACAREKGRCTVRLGDFEGELDSIGWANDWAEPGNNRLFPFIHHNLDIRTFNRGSQSICPPRPVDAR